MRFLFVFGAGASSDAGAPLMADFLDTAERVYRSERGNESLRGDAFIDVLSCLAELHQGVFAKSYLDVDNIETLFSAVEMGQLIGRFVEREAVAIDQLRDSLIHVIVQTLEHSVRFPVYENSIQSPEPYRSFARQLARLRSKRQAPPVPQFGFITFNYDLALDHALRYEGVGYDYGLDPSIPVDTPLLLKLHGSINWGRCTECTAIVPYPVQDARFSHVSRLSHVRYDLGTSISRAKHCQVPLEGPPVLVPPTWNKTESHRQLTHVWAKAAEEFSAAEHIFIIGYSLPDTDYFFRYLYALGAISDTRIKTFWIVNPDPDGAVEARFRELIGRGIEGRFRVLNGEEGRFEKAVDRIIKEVDGAVSAFGEEGRPRRWLSR